MGEGIGGMGRPYIKFELCPFANFTRLDNFLPLSSNLELSSENSFSLEGSKICRLGKGLAKVISFSSVMFPGVCPCFLTIALTQLSFQ